MKIQCPCGTKYSFDITPEMARAPIRFVCQTCGLDSSETVNELIRRELASTPEMAAPPPPSPSTQAGHDAQAGGATHVRIQPRIAGPPAAGDTEARTICSKHPGQVAAHRCVVCQKPICPKCMELFGYVCSPYCNAKAETEGIEVPEYAGKKSTTESRHWRKLGWAAGAMAAVVIGLLGLWFWYAWIGSIPRPVFSVRFAEPVLSGASVLCGKDQIVFLHGATLARYDTKNKKQIWSRQLIDRKQLARDAERGLKEMEAAKHKLSGENPDAADSIRTPASDELVKNMEQLEAAALRLHVRGQNIWVSSARNLIRYDWNTGSPTKEYPLGVRPGGLISRGDELLAIETGESGQRFVNHINMETGEVRLETIGEPPSTLVASSASKRPRKGAAAGGAEREKMAGLPLGSAGADAGRPMDPARVAEQVQNLTFPARIALPAILAGALNQERALAEMDDDAGSRARKALEAMFEPADGTSFIPAQFGYVQFSVQMLEAHFVTRNAMKAPPAKSVLDGNLSVTKTAEVANELLNEAQREHGGGTVTEDESRYQVTVRRPDVKDAAEWTGEVIGPPSLFPLKTVSVVAAGKMLTVLDSMNKKLWQATLSYSVPRGGGAFGADAERLGQGPCVERGGTLYVCDADVLSAFDLATGNVRWRIPSVGISGVFFDDEGMMYVNTTTASPESLKYSRQIDVTRKTGAIILKVDPSKGKTLWTAEPGGILAYVSGKYVYTLRSHQADEDERSRPYLTGLEVPSHVMIKRLNPRDGRELWQHYEPRVPLDVRFDGNSIQLVFKKEVEVLRFISF